MTEYIIDKEWIYEYESNIENLLGHRLEYDSSTNPTPPLRMLVHCRDCKFYDKEWTSEAYRNRFWCGKMGHYMQPYGFCAWGERK